MPPRQCYLLGLGGGSALGLLRLDAESNLEAKCFLFGAVERLPVADPLFVERVGSELG